MKLWLSGILLAISLGLLASPHASTAAAGNGSTITVRPFLENTSINPGDTTKDFELTVGNDSNSQQVFHFTVLDFGSLDESGGIAFSGTRIKQLTSKYGLSNWLSLDRNDILLGANQQTNVKATIRNASDLSPGAHYAAIIVTASKPIAPVGQLTITPKVSSLVFVTKTGGARYGMHLVSLDHDGTLWHLPDALNIRFTSTGNTYVIPRGVVSIRQNDRLLARGVINQQSSLVLPETIRNFEVPLQPVAKPKSGLFFTRYTLQVDYRYDGFNNYATVRYEYRIFNKITAFVGAAIIVILTLAAAAIIKDSYRRAGFMRLIKGLSKRLKQTKKF